MSDETAIQLMSEGKNELSVADVRAQVAKIKELMQAVLVDGQHYGVIPGTNKPTLLKPGAEKINYLFRIGMGDLQVINTDLGNGHREITIKTPMVHIPTGKVIAYGVGSCSTMESKYRYRNASRKCPRCHKETIIKGKEEYGGGWLCFAKKGGCGAKFKDHDEEITSQDVGQSENKDIADTYNTVLKMAAKRSYVDGTIKGSAASDFFTQDVEDMAGDAPVEAKWTPADENQPVTPAPAGQAMATPTGKPAHTLGDRLTTIIMSKLITEPEREEIRREYKLQPASQRSKYLDGWEADLAGRKSDPGKVTIPDGTQAEIPFGDPPLGKLNTQSGERA